MWSRSRTREPLQSMQFTANLSVDSKSLKKKWLDSTERSLDLMNSSHRRFTLTCKPVPVCSSIPNGELMMLQEDISGRLVKRIELVSEHQQLEFLLESISETHRNYQRLGECEHRYEVLQKEVVEVEVKRRRLQERREQLMSQKEENEELLETVQGRRQDLEDEERLRRAEYEKRVLEFGERWALGKVVRQFLREYKQATGNKRQAIRTQFVRFQKSILPSNRSIQLQRLTQQLKTNYTKLTKQYSQKYVALDSAKQKIQSLLSQCLEETRQLQRQLLTAKVNQQISKSQLSQLKKQQQSYLLANQKSIQSRASTIFQQYLQKQLQAFNNIQLKYGRQLRSKIAEQSRNKFYLMIKEQLKDEVEETEKLRCRARHVSKMIEYNTNEIERVLLPQVRRLRRVEAEDEMRPFRSEFVEIQRELPEEDRRESAYQYVTETQNTSLHRDQGKSGKRSLDGKRCRMSIDDKPEQYRSLAKNSNAYWAIKTKKDSLRTQPFQPHPLSRPITIPSPLTLPTNSSTPQLLPLLRQLSVSLTPIYKKSFSHSPTFPIETANFLQLGYSARLLSLSPDIGLELRVGTRVERPGKNAKVDQTIPVQRIRRIEKVRAGLGFAVCLDKGVLDIVFKLQEEFDMWYNGLAVIIRNRAILGKVKGKIR